jgi:tetratricopeptide (TPR) repeat protein
MACYAESLEIKTQIGDTAGQVRTMINQGGLYQEHGDYGAALRCFQESLALCKRLCLPEPQARALANIGIVQFMRGSFDKAMTSFEQARAIFESLGDAYGLADCLYRQGDVALAQREPRAANEYGQCALRLARQVGSAAYESCALRVIGEALAQQGDLDTAMSLLDRARQLQEQVRDPYDHLLIRVALARVVLVQGDQAKAEAHIVEGLALARRQRLPYQISLLEELARQLAAAR